MRSYPYNTDDDPGGDYDHERSRRGTFNSIVLGGSNDIVEIPHIKSMSWSRSIDQDVAECTIVVLNSTMTPLGTDSGPDFDNPGAFSEREAGSSVLWPHITSGWQGRIQPDRLIRTYEGYGVDWSQWPGEDPNLYASGVWLIDEVTYATNGDMTIKCRDVGRVLLDQIAFPPSVPAGEYPVEWSRIRTDNVPGRAPTGGHWNTPSGGRCSSSNNAYIGAGIYDKPAYVGPNGGVQGHRAQDVMLDGTGLNDMFWLSTGQESTDDKVWWQVDWTNPRDIAGLRIRTKLGGYQIYVSLYKDGRWLGKKQIPYEVTTAGIDIGAGINFVSSFRNSRNADYDLALPRKFKNIEKVRLTFTRLRKANAWGGVTDPTATITPTSHPPYYFRAALTKFGVYEGKFANLGFDNTGTLHRPVGNVVDYTDIVAWILAWGGFYWPASSSGNFIRTSPYGTPTHFTYSEPMLALPKGRVWGSLQYASTGPVADLTADNFDKQPLYESISQVRDVLGYVAYVDEGGAFIFRMPNIQKFGNYGLNNPPHRAALQRTNQVITIDEHTTLIDYEARTSSANLRDRIGVTDTQGKYGSVIQGYRPPNYDTNLRRTALWSDGHFASNVETRVAADLIAARQMLDYRRGRLTIWGNPAIQIDDQVRIIERTTGETFYHYVNSIEAEIDLEEGTFTYSLETSWLGQSPQNGEWVVDTQKLEQATKNYLNLLGQEA